MRPRKRDFRGDARKGAKNYDTVSRDDSEVYRRKDPFAGRNWISATLLLGLVNREDKGASSVHFPLRLPARTGASYIRCEKPFSSASCVSVARHGIVVLRVVLRSYTWNQAKTSISRCQFALKGKSSLMIFRKRGNMKLAYRNREFWCKGYYVDTVGKNGQAIKEYIVSQLKYDKEADKLSIFDPRDPFTGM